MTYKVTEEGNVSTVFLNGEVDMDVTEKAKEVIYYDEYSQLKELKFKDFLNKMDEINYIDSEQALNILESN